MTRIRATSVAAILCFAAFCSSSQADQERSPAVGPLPAPSKQIARNWPPAVQERVEDLLTLFSGDMPPTTQEIESRFKVRLVKQELTTSDRLSFKQIYVVVNADGDGLTPRRPYTLFSPSYFVAGRVGSINDVHYFTIRMDVDGYCLNPYDIAIHTGSTFSEGDLGTVHARNPYWGNLYEWGMFSRSPSGSYLGKGILLSVSHRVNSDGRTIPCTEHLGVTKAFKRQPPAAGSGE